LRRGGALGRLRGGVAKPVVTDLAWVKKADEGCVCVKVGEGFGKLVVGGVKVGGGRILDASGFASRAMVLLPLTITGAAEAH